MKLVIPILAAAWLGALPAPAQTNARIHYLQRIVPPPPTLSQLDVPPDDLGLAGARLAIDDNATTGRFLGQTFTLDATVVPPDGDLAAAADTALQDTDLLLIDAPAADVLAIADMADARDALLFNVAAAEPALRNDHCRANVLHTLPSMQMRTDALAQFFVLKKWTDLPMIAGGDPSDQAFAASMERSLAKYGLRPGPRKEWRFDANMRRNASAEVPLFTQDFGRYDALIVADEIHDFGRYLLYNTWQPRPVAGSEGLTPVGWDRVVEQWGAQQLQNRFTDLTARAMHPKDYAAWAAIRTIGEAVTRAGATDAASLRGYILSPDFELGGFLGRPLTFRGWNGQMRQPIPLVHPRALVAQAPLEGFLHPLTELDTLGLDAPESQCKAFSQ